MNNKYAYYWLYVYAALLVAFDQITKIMVKSSMSYGESIPVIGDFFRFTFIENPGMAFGIRFGGRWFFAIFSLVASIALVYYLYRMRDSHWSMKTALVLILGGATGNLIDRMLFGRVVDFFDVEFFDIPAFEIGSWYFHGLTRWPIFNMADSYVTIGMVLLIVNMYFFSENIKIGETSPDKIGS